MDNNTDKDLVVNEDITEELLKRLIFLRDSGVDYLPISSDLPLPPVKTKPAVIEDLVEAECTRCELSTDRPDVIVGVGGGSKVRLMVVGDSPTTADEGSGKPFSGAQGELLGKIVKAMGLDSVDLFLCYTVRCSSKLAVTEDHINKCRVHLINDFLRVKPKVVLSFGSMAKDAVRELDFKNTFSVPGLNAMIDDESLKLETWDAVRKIMKLL